MCLHLFVEGILGNVLKKELHFFFFIDNSIFKIGTAVIYFRVKPRYEKLSIYKKKLSILKIIKDENETHFELQFDSAEHIDPSI